MRDREKFLCWCKDHSSTSLADVDGLVSLETGVVGDPKVNCDDAYAIGCKFVGRKFTFSLQRKDKVVTRSSLSTAVKIRGEEIIVDPIIIFHRLALVINKNDGREEFFSYELATEPTSLFKNGLMRKGTKVDKGKNIRKNVNSLTLHPEGALYVLDGGWLLRKVTWTQNVSTDGELCQNDVNYVKRKFGTRVVVIFDGYENEENSTKAHEHHLRSSKHISREIHVGLRTTVTTSQDKFLANSVNKVRLINILRRKDFM